MGGELEACHAAEALAVAAVMMAVGAIFWIGTAVASSSSGGGNSSVVRALVVISLKVSRTGAYRMSWWNARVLCVPVCQMPNGVRARVDGERCTTSSDDIPLFVARHIP